MIKSLNKFVLAVFTVALFASTAVFAGSYGKKKSNDIVDVAAGNESFSTLVAAVKAAGLVDTLKSDGPFTVFAPTNEAFAKLPEGTVENLLKPENKDKLVAVLTYHVVPGKVLAKDVVGLSQAKTAQGSEVKISTAGGGVKVDNANVVATDIAASNGVIHVIDSVILPK
ncbi:fasciclin domain-containing protein [Aliikangiella marina]|uniref:Fasciclin domain-containing protein n=1 Tax=Aliikangiella marina TaxID=1712262 RepID=A0A545T7F2_9GAMM|nr:fasciclin domain-containing protein [Aliikangiella marina]TQV73146.1 fasciclin domain-containing protein [Aliikangiella marina]